MLHKIRMTQDVGPRPVPGRSTNGLADALRSGTDRGPCLRIKFARRLSALLLSRFVKRGIYSALAYASVRSASSRVGKEFQRLCQQPWPAGAAAAVLP
jgi:hypothetical protein